MLGGEKQKRSDALKQQLRLIRDEMSLVDMLVVLRQNDIDDKTETVRRWMRKKYKADILSNKIARIEIACKVMRELIIKKVADKLKVVEEER